ncbi:LysR family transcriptional regulator [Paeniglutamicibacter sp. MACA_103]|uniref:LysR family transcriptional regulator n=1 Tax=Paeniglutamicibacter sp. MACA_103 TaxID=3377337 RepID=UPI0038960FCA
MKFTLRQLEIFLAVAAELHFARGAESLHISQPTVSQEIRRLEQALHVKLFDRTTRSAHLTRAGEALVEDARAIVTSAGQLGEKALMFSPDRVRSLRVVASPSVVNKLLPDVMSQAEREIPTLTIQDIPVDTGSVASRLASEGGDIGIGRFLQTPTGFNKQTLVQEPLLVAVSATHPMAGKPAISLPDLGDLPLLLWPRELNPEYYDHLIQTCHDAGLAPLILVGPPLIAGARSYLIAENRAFSLIPQSAANHLSNHLRTVRLKTPAFLPLEMLWLKRDPREIVPQVLELIRQKAEALASVDGN